MSKAFAALAALALVAGGLKEFPDAAQQARDTITGAMSQPAVGSAQDASASSDLASSSTIIEMYAPEFGVPAGVFVSPGQQTLPDGSPLTSRPARASPRPESAATATASWRDRHPAQSVTSTQRRVVSPTRPSLEAHAPLSAPTRDH